MGGGKREGHYSAFTLCERSRRNYARFFFTANKRASNFRSGARVYDKWRKHAFDASSVVLSEPICLINRLNISVLTNISFALAFELKLHFTRYPLLRKHTQTRTRAAIISITRNKYVLRLYKGNYPRFINLSPASWNRWISSNVRYFYQLALGT